MTRTVVDFGSKPVIVAVVCVAVKLQVTPLPSVHSMAFACNTAQSKKARSKSFFIIVNVIAVYVFFIVIDYLSHFLLDTDIDKEILS